MKDKLLFGACLLTFLLTGCAGFVANDIERTMDIRRSSSVDGYNLAAIDLPIEEIHYKNTDGTGLYAWFIKHEHPDQVPTIIFLAGRLQENLRDYLPHIRNLSRGLAVNVFACDLPGRGESKGTANLKNAYEMTLAAIDHVSRMPGIRKDCIVLYGLSKGGTLALYGASKREGLPVIIESSFTSTDDLAGSFYGIVFGASGERFDNYQVVRDLKNPKLFIHGLYDPIVDVKYVKQLYETASEPKDSLWIESGHILLGDRDIMKLATQKIESLLADCSK